MATPNKLADYVSEIRRRANRRERATSIWRDLLSRGVDCSVRAVQLVAYDPRRYAQGPPHAPSHRNFGKRRRPPTETELNEIRHLREAGIPATDLAEAYQVSRRTVTRLAPVGSTVIPPDLWEWIKDEVTSGRRRIIDVASEYCLDPDNISSRLRQERRRRARRNGSAPR